MSGRAVPSTLTCQWVAPAGAGGEGSRRAPSRDSTAGAAGVAGAVALGVVPVAGRERLGPFQSPAVARRAQGVPAVMPVNWLLAVPRGRVRLVLPTVSCQPVAPVGAVVGSLTVRVLPVPEVWGVQGVGIGTPVPVVAALVTVVEVAVVEVTVAAARPRR